MIFMQDISKQRGKDFPISAEQIKNLVDSGEDTDMNRKGKKQGGPLSRAVVGYCDAWYRELDLVLGELMMALLLGLSLLPIAFLQTRILFNTVYAGALDTMAARRHLVLYVYSQINLAGLWALARFCARQTAEFCGWVLTWLGLRQTVTDLLRRTWCWRWFETKKDAGYNVLFDTESGRFVPTESFTGRAPHSTPEACARSFAR